MSQGLFSSVSNSPSFSNLQPVGSNFKKTDLELSLLVQEMTYAVSYRTKTLQECIISVISDFVSCFKTFFLFRVTEITSFTHNQFKWQNKNKEEGKSLCPQQFKLIVRILQVLSGSCELSTKLSSERCREYRVKQVEA